MPNRQILMPGIRMMYLSSPILPVFSLGGVTGVQGVAELRWGEKAGMREPRGREKRRGWTTGKEGWKAKSTTRVASRGMENGTTGVHACRRAIHEDCIRLHTPPAMNTKFPIVHTSTQRRNLRKLAPSVPNLSAARRGGATLAASRQHVMCSRRF